MNEELYLILHKVRGEPAFDVAEIIGEDSDGEIWIIPTSGHRAYPAHAWLLSALRNDEGLLANLMLYVNYPGDAVIESQWADWPDHYTVKADSGGYGHKEFRRGAVSDLLNRLGLNRKPSLMRRLPK